MESSSPVHFSREPARPLQLCVRVTQGAERGLVHAIGAAPVIIGTSASSDVCLSDRSVSRAHCQLLARAGECVVRDLGSTNGTYVDGAVVVEALIPIGSRLRLGTTELLLEEQTETEAATGETVEFGDMVGRSRPMLQVFAELRSAARTSQTCLLLGETGTGKELAARALHAQSDRAAGPFLVVNCAGVGPQFMDDKLFGHEPGALAGTTAAAAGVFEQARGGTVFLDDVGELQLELQAKLLSVLERAEATRIGATAPVPVDVRLVAAAHPYLVEMVRRETFRADLFERLAQLTLRIPALHERAEDIPLIAEAVFAREGFGGRTLSADAVAYLQQLRWPGNVRELRNLLRRAALLTTGTVIDQQLLEDLASTTAEVQVTREELDAAAARQAAADPPATLQPTTARTRRGGSVKPEPSSDLDSRTTPGVKPALEPEASGSTPGVKPALEPEASGADCASFALPLEQSIESHRRAYMHYLRRRFGNDVQAAAAHAGVHPRSIARLFRLYGAS